MIDFTPIQARDYSRVIEAPGITQDQIDSKAAEVLRGLSALDLSDALYDLAPKIKTLVQQGHEFALGNLIRTEINDYCKRVALRVLEA